MPEEITKRNTVLEAIKSVNAIAGITATHDGHFEHEIDLEVIVYGRNYNGKKVGPYVRLLVYSNGEEITKEGEWGGNTFYVVIAGRPEVYVGSDGQQVKVAEISPGDILGEMAILAGVPRSATVRAPHGGSVQMLEVQRPALRLLRKLPEFGQSLDTSYRHHGRNSIVHVLGNIASLDEGTVKQLEAISQFRVFGKGHVLFRAGEHIRRIYVLKSGWIRLSAKAGTAMLAPVQDPSAWGATSPDTYFGPSHVFGLEGLQSDGAWNRTGVLLGRTELLEISVSQLRQNPQLAQALMQSLQPLHVPPSEANHGQPAPIAEAQHELISTGFVDGTNLMLMDMELCVRCGNCSFACHKMHGNSRLLRRGISITRPSKLKKGAHMQHLLNPSVCMHCKDPECMTGCPTGAIGRFPGGQVDIDPKTCIGCGDCATQCPYDAISLIARRPNKNGAGAGALSLLSLAQPPIPDPVQETDDLVAVKCNLCNNTPLNPEGRKSQAFSCEQNCPTGALLRVNPRTYFGEIKSIEGVYFHDSTHAVVRHTSHKDPKKRLMHALGIVSTVALTLLSLAALWRFGRETPLIFGWLDFYWMTGLVGLVGIIGVMLYPVRRQIYRRRAGPLRYWMLSHAYMGVIAGILLLLHGGWRGGGVLTTFLMITFDLVILTGLWGIAVYYIAPRMLTKIEEQPLLVDDLQLRRDELAEQIAETSISVSDDARRLIEKRVVPKFLSIGYLIRQYLKKEKLVDMTTAARKTFEAEVQGLPAAEREEVLRVAEMAATMRRVDALIYLHRSLKMWLAPHVLTTSLMLALMIVHIVQVTFFLVK